MKMNPTRSLLLALALAAVALPGFAAEPVNIARLAGTTAKVVSGSGVEGTGFSGATGFGELLDGNLRTCTRLQNIGTGGYIQLDFPEPYFVTTIIVTKWYRHKYSLSIFDGTSWVPVDYATSVNRYGTKRWGVYKKATKVMMSFPEASTHCEDVSELEVWGVPVAGMTCPHSNLSAWTEVAGSATCTNAASEMATCSDCGEDFVREGNLPLGHDYKANVTKPGIGWFSCSRCNHRIDCSNGAIDLMTLGGMYYDQSLVLFCDVETSVFCYGESWGTRNDSIVDNNLTTAWTPPVKGQGAYVDIHFATTILLNMVEMTISGTGGLPVNVQVEKLDNGEGVELKKQTLRVDSSSPTNPIEFSDAVVDAIRIHFSPGWNDYSKINEIRVYGTVPGAVNYIPALILMQ